MILGRRRANTINSSRETRAWASVSSQPTMMKSVVFARSLNRRPTGRGVIAYEMIRRLQAHGIDSLDVFAGEPPEVDSCRYWPARGSNPFTDAWRVLRGVAADVRAINPDVLWSATHFLPSGLPKSLPKVVTLLDAVWRDHPETMSRANRWAASWLERGLSRADRIFCISDFTKSRLAAHWPELAERARVIHLAPNERLQKAESVPAPVKGPFVLNVDTVEPRKNLGPLLEAMGSLQDLNLVQCGGTGWNVDGLLARARALPNVRFLGYADEAILASLYRSAACAVFPSVYEGFHIPPLDAASLGCPSVLSDIPVHREVMGDAAVYFRLEEPGALVRAIRSLIDEPDRRSALSTAARARAARYRWDDSAAALARLLREAAGP